MAGDEQGDRIATAGRTDSAGRVGAGQFCCQFTITARFAIGDAPQRGPDALLEGRSGNGQGQRVQIDTLAMEVGEHRFQRIVGGRITPGRAREAAIPFGPQTSGLSAEQDGADAAGLIAGEPNFPQSTAQGTGSALAP